ncbi:hypothetical protein PYW07_011135 [Mythimna separata]|uniref:Uncharacterized protein n=1 Tax=Mythimna separata TaxID=271217 RepID=A0AAD7Y7K4_MYTSE|nr:hypothetical protein PYW07_011135 [Mythimna separata]
MILYISLCFILVVLADPLPGKHVPLESYESELEREHALPTSVPNADILKTNSNPTYHKPRPPQHHGAALLAGVGGGAAVPSYAPPGRAFFTPPLPPEYRNPFADKPTLRGTNTDGNNYLNRRPIPPPSLGPGHDRIPIRPPGQETSSPQVPAPPPAPPMPPPGIEPQKKKALNTPSHKPDELDSDIKQPGTDQANFTDFVPNSLNIPTISRILSGSNGRKEDIPDVLLRTVTAKPQHNQEKTSKSDIFVTKEVGVTLSDSSRDSSTEGSVLAVLDPEMNNLDRPLIVDQNGETNTRRNLQYATNKQTDRNDSRKDEYTPATTIGFELKDPEMSTERYHNLANVNSDKKILKQDSKNSGPVQRPGAAWPFAWNLHIYLATVMFTILAVYSIYKIFCYNNNEQFESDYPAICNTNTNLHTYTMRTGKPIYETAGHHPVMPDACCGPVLDHQRFQLNTLTGNCDTNSGTENYSGHSSIANAGHSSSTESSNATSSQGVTNHLIKHHPNVAGYNGIESASDDHYSNCDPAIQSLQGDDPLDHEYNVIQYGSNSDFIRDIKNQNYNAGSNRSSHNFKHMSYDRVSSRTNSNPRKKHRAKNKNVQNCMTMGYDASIGHHYHQPHTPDEYGNYNTENASYHASGIQTLNPNRSYNNDPCQQIRSSQRRNSPSTSMVNSSGSQKRGKGNGFPDRPKSTDLYGFSEDPNERGYPCALGGTPQPAPRNCSYEASYSQPQDEIPTEAEGNSMLVAQDGFLRIRSMKDPSPNPQPSHT